MEISLIDKRINPGEPGFDTPLGESTSVSLDRDRGLHILDIKTTLAYNWGIKLTRADIDQLRGLLIEEQAAEKRKAKD